MNATEVLALVNTIAATGSKKEKEHLVGDGMRDPFFAKVMKATYDPFVTYGLRDIPKADPNGEGTTDLSEPHAWNLLDELANRQLSGDAARDMVAHFMRVLRPESGALLWRILRKDMRAGFTEGTINRVVPGTIPEFPYMRCSLPPKSDMEKWDWADGIISQEKADGMFANVNKDDHGCVWISSRQGSPFPLDAISLLVTDISRILANDTQTHGELLVLDDGLVLPREKGNGILNSILQGGDLPEKHRVMFYAWDQIPLGAVKSKGKYATPYKDRLRSLVAQLVPHPVSSIQLIGTRVCKTRSQAFDHYREMLRQGKEGTILKHPLTPWRDGTSKSQVKLKLEVDVELKVVGFVPGEGKNESTFGSLLCQSSCGELEVAVSGFSDKLRKELHELTDPVGIITVRANSIMAPSASNKKHSLFLPRFVERRLDKTEADSLQLIKDQFVAKVAA